MLNEEPARTNLRDTRRAFTMMMTKFDSASQATGKVRVNWSSDYYHFRAMPRYDEQLAARCREDMRQRRYTAAGARHILVPH